MGRDGRAVRHRPWRKCELDAPSLPSSQFLPIGRWSRSRQASRRRGQPDVGEGQHDRAEPDRDDGQHRERRDRPPGPGPGPSCAGRRRPPALGAGEAASAVGHGRPATTADDASDGRRRVPRGAVTRRRRSAPRPARPRPARARRPATPAASTGRRGLALGEDPHRLGPVERGQDQRSAEPRRHRRRPGGVEHRARRRRSRARPRRPARSAAGPASPGGVPAGTRSATSAAVPSDSRTTTTSPSSSAASSTAIASRPSRISNGTRSRRSSRSVQPTRPAELQPGPPEDERPMGVVLEVGLGVDPALDRDVARRARRRASAPRRPSTTGVDASSRPTR